MEKIALSEIKNTEDYRAIIPIKINGKIENIYVRNPKSEVFEELWKVLGEIVDNGKYVDGDMEVDESGIILHMMKMLTNIEVDTEDDVLLVDRIEVLEVISVVKEIYNEMLLRLKFEVIEFYESERNRLVNERLEKSYNSFREALDE